MTIVRKSKSSEQTTTAKLTRRDFLNRSAGVTFMLGAGGMISACSNEETATIAAPAAASSDPYTPNIWVTIFPDNTIEIKYSGTEMGARL